MDWTQEMKGAAMQDAAKVCELTDQLAAANKAIVALADGLDQLINIADSHGMSATYWRVFDNMLKENAPAIEKARGG